MAHGRPPAAVGKGRKRRAKLAPMNTSLRASPSLPLRLVCTALLGLGSAGATAAAWPTCAGETLRPVRPEFREQARFGGLPSAPENPVGCLFGLPMRVDDDTTLWRCTIDPELQEAALAASGDDVAAPEYLREDGRVDEDLDPRRWSEALLLIRRGQPVRAWRDSVMAGTFEAWTLHRVDLDGDGRAENVVALWNAQGNGLGVNHWTLRVFSPDWELLDSRAGIADWGASSLRAPVGRAGCDLAVTGWVEDRSTGRDGIAFEARFLQLRDGRLVEAETPPVRRRYTYAFQAQRSAWFDAEPDRLEGDPAGWLGD
jgi:hypothetical protein